MKRRRVKITGIGPVTPAGIGKEEFWKGILEPVSRVRALKKFPEEAGPFAAAEVRNFKIEHYHDGMNGKRVPRHTQFALAAAKLAAADAGMRLSDLRGRGTIVIVGATLMDFGSINRGVELILRKGPACALPTSVADSLVSGIGSAISDLIGGTTRTMSLQSACCAGLDSVGRAAEMIALGEADVAICGGTEAPLFFHPMLELKLAGLAPGNSENPERQCRPFDMWRTTGVIGEGACVMILEPEESPRPGYAFIAGYGFASDPTDAPCEGLEHAMRLGLANAQLRAVDVESISTWGPGHKILDAAEALAIKSVLSEGTDKVPAVSLKGAIANPLAAAGAIQVACAALGIRRGVMPGTVNWQYPDPDCHLNLSGSPRCLGFRNAMINAHGLSGTNACVVLTQ
jgi:3-oxoacyl-[acyl-carrier-protein] synthase II